MQVKLSRCMSQRRCVKASSVADAALMVALLLPLDRWLHGSVWQ